MSRSRPRLLVPALLFAALTVGTGCSTFAPNEGEPGQSVGLQVRNGLEIQIALWMDGRIIEFVPPFQTMCVRIPLPFQNGIITITDNEIPVRNQITRTTRTRFETRTGWALDLSIPIRTPLAVSPSPACV